MKKLTAPIPFAGSELGETRHSCAFFSSREESYRVLLPFIQSGFEQGDRAIHVINSHEREDHLRRLTQAGINTNDAVLAGQLDVRSNTDTYLRNGRFDQDLLLASFEAIASGNAGDRYPRSRIVCQMDWASDCPAQSHELIAFESRVNDVWSRHEDAVICVYDLNRISGDMVVDVIRTHPMVVIGGVLHRNPFFMSPESFLQELNWSAASQMSPAV